eukprot:SAG11_NODE_169_length_13635_cov_13.307993_6_plen_1033_part_00
MPSLKDYKVFKEIGSGAFGRVILVSKGDEKFCIKQIDVVRMSKKEQDDAIKEAKMLKKFDHPNIVRYEDFFIDGPKLCIVMELAEDGDLYARVKKQGGKRFSEQQVLNWFVQICLAIKHVHDRKVLHRDIKTQNIFLTRGGSIIKIGDFGISRVLGSTHEKAKTQVGTPYYLSPEICLDKAYDHKSDIWSLGCVLYELTTLKHAFDAGSMHALVLKIMRGKYAPVSNSYSEPLRSLIGEMLARDPNRRPSINDVLKRPVMQERIRRFLSDSVAKREFSHTVLHNQNPMQSAVDPIKMAAARQKAAREKGSRQRRLPSSGAASKEPRQQAGRGAAPRPGSRPGSREQEQRLREKQARERARFTPAQAREDLVAHAKPRAHGQAVKAAARGQQQQGKSPAGMPSGARAAREREARLRAAAAEAEQRKAAAGGHGGRRDAARRDEFARLQRENQRALEELAGGRRQANADAYQARYGGAGRDGSEPAAQHVEEAFEDTYEEPWGPDVPQRTRNQQHDQPQPQSPERRRARGGVRGAAGGGGRYDERGGERAAGAGRKLTREEELIEYTKQNRARVAAEAAANRRKVEDSIRADAEAAAAAAKAVVSREASLGREASGAAAERVPRERQQHSRGTAREREEEELKAIRERYYEDRLNVLEKYKQQLDADSAAVEPVAEAEPQPEAEALRGVAALQQREAASAQQLAAQRSQAQLELELAVLERQREEAEVNLQAGDGGGGGGKSERSSRRREAERERAAKLEAAKRKEAAWKSKLQALEPPNPADGGGVQLPRIGGGAGVVQTSEDFRVEVGYGVMEPIGELGHGSTAEQLLLDDGDEGEVIIAAHNGSDDDFEIEEEVEIEEGYGVEEEADLALPIGAEEEAHRQMDDYMYAVLESGGPSELGTDGADDGAGRPHSAAKSVESDYETTQHGGGALPPIAAGGTPESGGGGAVQIREALSPLEGRVAALRDFLTRQLGADLMGQVYGRLRSMEAMDNEEEQGREMEALLARHDQDVSCLNLIHRLIFCEDQLHSAT